MVSRYRVAPATGHLLPLTYLTGDGVAVQEEDTPVEVTPATILVVDDNPLIVMVIQNILGGENYTVHTAKNGAEALDLLGKKTVDVIVCDVMMPQMDGYAFHEKVRGRTDLAHIPFIFLTALNDAAQIKKGKSEGVDDYLGKPFDPDELLSVVRGKVKRSNSLRRSSEERYDSYRKKVIHTLSHEFRTPLVAINTGTDLLLERKGAIEEQKVRHLLEAIQRGGRRLEQLVNDFMALQQIEAGVAKRVHDAHASYHLVSDIARGFKEHAEELVGKEGFNLTLSDKSDGAKVFVYLPQINDLLGRLVSNSIKFKLKVMTVDIVTYRQEEDACIEVRDRGLGLDPERVREAIDAFGQLDREKLEQQGGGLGLAIANKYAHLNGGRLEFDARKGGGSIVTLLLPIKKGT